MTKERLLETLDYIDATRKKRNHMAQMVLQQPELIKPLIEIVFMGKDPISSRASWVLEFTLKKKLSPLFPHLDFFLDGIGKVRLESSVRPMAKICECLILDFFSKKKTRTKEVLTDEHLEKIATACFDWLIGDHKVAPKAYSMTSLYLLGTRFRWIHPELKLVLEQHYASGSAAYQARARQIFERLKKEGSR